MHFICPKNDNVTPPRHPAQQPPTWNLNDWHRQLSKTPQWRNIGSIQLESRSGGLLIWGYPKLAGWWKFHGSMEDSNGWWLGVPLGLWKPPGKKCFVWILNRLVYKQWEHGDFKDPTVASTFHIPWVVSLLLLMAYSIRSLFAGELPSISEWSYTKSYCLTTDCLLFQTQISTLLVNGEHCGSSLEEHWNHKPEMCSFNNKVGQIIQCPTNLIAKKKWKPGQQWYKG